MILLSFLNFSCNVQFPVANRIQRDFDCWDGSYTGLDTLINIKGFYTQTRVRDNTGLYGFKNKKLVKLESDTLRTNMIFFEDGIFIGGIKFGKVPIEDWLELLNQNGRGFGERRFYHGSYEVIGDTVKVQRVSPGYGNVWTSREDWYLIKGDNTMAHVFTKFRGLTNSDKKQDRYQPVWYKSPEILEFVEAKNIPESNSWLKHEKWFRCN